MTTIKQVLLLSFLFFAILAKAQSAFLPDEIWYDTGKNIYVHFCLPTVYDVSKYTDDTKTFADLYNLNLPAELQKSGKKISVELDEQKGESAIRTMEDYNLVDIFPSEFHQGNVSELQKLKLTTKDGSVIYCYFDDLSDLMLFLKADWKTAVKAIDTEINNDTEGFKRKPVILLYQDKDGKIQSISKSINSTKNYLDQLGLAGSVGMNFFKSGFLPSLKFQLSLIFNKKGIFKDDFFVDYEIMYDFVSENNQSKIRTGHFIDLGYKYNFSKKPDKANWYGISVGYLIHKKSDIFDDHTWRISVHRNLTKNIELMPQVYFPKDFSNIFPGLSLNVNF